MLQRYFPKANLSPFLSLLYPTVAEIPRITDVTMRHRSGARLGSSAPYPELSAQRGKQLKLAEILGPESFERKGVRHV